MNREQAGRSQAPAGEVQEVRFATFVLDLEGPELKRHGAPVPIRATPLRLLVALARRIGQVVPREQLMNEVWPGVAVTDASLSTALRELRTTLGDDGRRQRFVQTLRHRGVRLVRPHGVAAAAAGAEAAVPDASHADAGGDADQRYDLLSRLGAMLFDSGRHEEARAAYREAARGARGEGNDAGFVQAALEFTGDTANMETAVYSDERVALLEEAIAYEEAVPPAVRARLRARLALNLAWTRRDQALHLALGAAEIARSAGDAGALARVLHDVYWVTWSPDNLEERHALAREMIGAAQDAGDSFLEGFAHLLESAVILETGERAAAETAAARGDERLRSREHAGLPVWRDGWLATMALLDGRFVEAERHAQEAFRHSRDVGLRNAPRIRTLQLGWLRFDQGRLGELGALAEALDASLPITQAGRALVLHAAGRDDEARLDFQALTDELDLVPRDPFWMGTLTVLAELALLLGDAQRAAVLYDALRPHEAQCVMIGVRSACRGSVALYLGLLARIAGRHDAVVPHLEAAVRVNAQLRAVPLLARAQLELARALYDRSRGDDVPRARAVLSASADLHRGVGLRHRDREIAALGRRLEEPAGG